MHEASLIGQIPAARHEKTLQILAGLTAMQPTRLVERHIIYKPIKPPVQQIRAVGGSQAIVQQKTQKEKQSQRAEQYFQQLVCTIDEGDVGDTTNGNTPNGAGGLDCTPEKPWFVLFRDVPLAGQRTVTLRQVRSTGLYDGDAHQFMTAQGNKYVTEYVTEGHRFIYNNIVVHIYRILRLPPTEAAPQIPSGKITPLSRLMALDGSGTCVIEATILLEAALKPDLVNKATAELEAFRDEMKGVVTLKMPARLSMDTTVKR